MCIITLVCCLMLTLFPAVPAGAAENTAVMPNGGQEQAPEDADDGQEQIPENGEIALDDSLSDLLETYFNGLLTVGIAGYDEADVERWLSADVVRNVISRVENLSEQEKAIDDVAFTVTAYDADTGELSAEVTETVNGTPFTTTHALQVSGGEDDGWRVESDYFMDSVLYDPDINLGAAPPTPPQTHPNTWKNTGNQAVDIAKIALTQEGYKEAYAGGVGNYTKYNVWYYGKNRPDPWCAIFISWCANQAGISTSVIKENAVASGYAVQAKVVKGKKIASMKNNSFGAPAYAFGEKAAKCGDIAYIDTMGDDVSHHVGLVYDADSSYIYTIEGNSGDKVTKRKFSTKTGHMGSSKTKIVFFARPNYVTDTQPPTLSIQTGQASYTITQGSECDVTGSITSNYPLTEVKATLGAWSASVPNLKGNSLDIGTSAINDFKGADLPVGTHTLNITAANSGGKTASASIPITVVAPAQISFSPNPLRIQQGTTEAVTVQFQGQNVGDLDISSIRESDLVEFKEWWERALSVGTTTLILEGKRVGKQNFQIALLNESGERLASGGLDVEVYALDERIKEYFDFEAEVTFQNPPSLYRTPTDAAPYGTFSQSTCLCNRGARLRDGSVWLAMTAEYGGDWFRVQDALNVTPVISVSPETLTLKVGETKTLSVRYSCMPDAKAFELECRLGEDIITLEEESRDDLPPLDSYGTVNMKLSVHADGEGTANIDFRLLDVNGNARAEKVFPVKVTSETVVPPDVSPEKYYYEAVKWAVEKNIIINPSQYFSPGDRCTRASAVTFLWRLAGAPAPASSHNPFTDVVAVDDYYNAVLWAVERGITNGTSETKFSPDAYCNRGQIVTFLHRYAGTPPAKGVNTFKDVAPGRFCYDSVNWASGLNITQGFSDNTFHPAEVCTRGQIITFIYRYAANN